MLLYQDQRGIVLAIESKWTNTQPRQEFRFQAVLRAFAEWTRRQPISNRSLTQMSATKDKMLELMRSKSAQDIHKP